jgi:ribosomal protein S18 acetylase RimI-like enzyme
MTGGRIGYVSLLAVAEPAEGAGLGRRLMAKAEEWCRAQGLSGIQLDVFASNGGGRGFYRRLGFGEETLRLVKSLE